MDPEGQHHVRVLAGILRIALGLDRGRRGVVKSLKCRATRGVLRIYTRSARNAELEIAAANTASKLFAQAIGRDVHVKSSRDG
jgi:hypothetical protein